VKYVLFVCTHNAGRSQMAQAFFERECRLDCRADSAGSQPARRVWAQYDDVPIRSHIFTLAHKQTCECLRQDTCALL
jgi:protein-tyrosine-phosphatase